MNVLLFVVIPLVVGYAVGKKGWFPERWIKPVQVFFIVTAQPVIQWFAIWQMTWKWQLAWLPLVGLVLAALNLGVGYMLYRSLPERRKGSESSIFATSLSNMGPTGGNLILLFLFGTQAVGEGTIFISYFMPWTFGLCFPLAARMAGPGYTGGRSLKGVLLAPHSMPIVGLTLGVVTLAYVPPPDWVKPTLEVLMKMTAPVSLAVLGTRIRISQVRHYVRKIVAVSGAKFLLTPVVGLAMAHLVGFDALTTSVVLVMSLCPVAVFSVVISHIFDLDVDLANSLFLVTSILFFIVIVPLLMLAQEVGVLPAGG
jgi:hypothetical protein